MVVVCFVLFSWGLLFVGLSQVGGACCLCWCELAFVSGMVLWVCGVMLWGFVLCYGRYGCVCCMLSNWVMCGGDGGGFARSSWNDECEVGGVVVS